MVTEAMSIYTQRKIVASESCQVSSVVDYYRLYRISAWNKFVEGKIDSKGSCAIFGVDFRGLDQRSLGHFLAVPEEDETSAHFRTVGIFGSVGLEKNV